MDSQFAALEEPKGSLNIDIANSPEVTGTYLAVALLGTDEERATFRAALDEVHAQVRSTSDSPVRYNAFDPRLQLWVAACLFYGGWDYYRRVYGELDPIRRGGVLPSRSPGSDQPPGAA